MNKGIKYMVLAAVACFAVSTAAAAVVFHDSFDYTVDNEFLAEGGWTYWSGTGGSDAANSKIWGEDIVLEYNHTNAVVEGDLLTVDATVLRTAGYFYGMQVDLWDGVDAGTRVNVASAVYDGSTAVAGSLTQLVYAVTAADITAGLTNSIYHYRHDSNWGETADVTFQVVKPGEPPYWPVDPIQGDDGVISNAYNGTLEGLAVDPNLDPITYSLVGPSTWLQVETNGVLSGTPVAGHEGSNTFTVAATTVDGTSNAVLNIFIAVPIDPPSNVLIDNATANGSFELFTDDGDGKVMFSDGLVPFWASWAEQASASGDTGTDNGSAGTHNGLDGDRVAFLEPGGAIVNMVTNAPYIIAEGDVIAYGFWNSLEGRDPATISLVYDDGGALTQITGTDLTAADGTQATGEFTVQAGDLWIGKTLGVGIVSGGSWPEVDQIFLGVTSRPADPVSDLVITGPVSGGTQMVLSWTGQAGASYGVDTNSNLIIANWGAVASGIPGIDGTVTYTNDIGAEGEVFYRVITE